MTKHTARHHAGWRFECQVQGGNASTVSIWSCRIYMFELTKGVLGGEPPVYDGGGLVALTFERRGIPSQQRFIADPAVQTLPAEDAELDSSHVQPASVIGCVGKLQAFGYAARLGRCKRFVERGGLVGVEIVQDQPDHFGVRVCAVHQPLHLWKSFSVAPEPIFIAPQM